MEVNYWFSSKINIMYFLFKTQMSFHRCVSLSKRKARDVSNSYFWIHQVPSNVDKYSMDAEYESCLPGGLENSHSLTN